MDDQWWEPLAAAIGELRAQCHYLVAGPSQTVRPTAIHSVPMKTHQTRSSRFSVRHSTCTPATPTPRSAPTFLLSVFCFLLFPGHASAATRYVDAASASPAPPYTNWATAARVIQDAVDVTEASDEIVVTNGVYATGERGGCTGAS